MDDRTITIMFRSRLAGGLNKIKIVCSPFIFVGNSLYQQNKMEVLSIAASAKTMLFLKIIIKNNKLH